MRIIPVLDIKNGIVVRGIGGRREEYRPIVSKLTTSCRPVDVARAFRDQLGLMEMYIADLDAIAGASPAWNTYEEIQALGCRLWVDAGVRQAADALQLNQHEIRDVVIGLETVAGPSVIEAICHQLDPNEIIFSLDLKDGRALSRTESWKTTDPFAIAAEAIGNGVRRLLILDLTRVGMGQGTGTEGICQRLADAYPDVELSAGGGIRDAGELRRLATCGVTSVLIASALHDGQLRPEHWQNI
jgi:phosphoribosylformimino-5-aminoimidazole carboxamide ribotide isomerase